MNHRTGPKIGSQRVTGPNIERTFALKTAFGCTSRGCLRHATCSLLLLLSLAGCLKPYSRSAFDPIDASFPGIISYSNHDPNRTVRVIFVHGMCTHTENSWINHGWDHYIPAYFLSGQPIGKTVLSVGPIDLHDREYRIGENTISARYVVWSKLTAADKARIQFDNSPPALGQFTWKRASLNASLKEGLVNDCLSDAVAYAGYRGPEMQAAMQDAICAALDGTPNNGVCNFPPGYLHGERRIVLVTESLGSRMVFDAVLSLKIQADSRGERTLEAFDEAVAPISQIFMLANQLPLLALAKPPIADPEALSPTSDAEYTSPMTPAMKATVQVLSDARARRALRRQTSLQTASAQGSISIVAFSDPNDLLSYRIPPNDQSILGDGATLVNVITSNAGALFGWVENPLPAHTNYNQNPDVLRLLFGGSQRSKQN